MSTLGFTQADLDAVRDAYRELITGKRKVSISFSSGGGSRSVSYTGADLEQLRSLQKTIADDIAKQNGASTSTTRYSRSRKSL